MATTIASTDVGGTGLSTVGTNGQVLTSNGTTLSWQTPSAGTSFSAGTTGFTPNTATTGTVTLAGTLNVSNGGTGLTSLTTGYIPFGSGTSAFGNSANLFWDNTNGRLGIGTSSPAQKLDVAGNTSSYNFNISANTGTVGIGSNSYVQFANGSGTPANTMIFVSNSAERMRIDSSGNVILTAAGNLNLSNLNTYSANSSGYQKLPSGIIIQWGTNNNTAGSWTTYTFPIAFPNNCYNVTASQRCGYYGGIVSGCVQNGSPSTTGFNYAQNGGADTFAWIAIGN